VAAGCDALQVVPIFWTRRTCACRRARAVDALRKRYSGIEVSLSRAAGEDGRVIDALASFCIGELEG
jgi:sirohydrochlorin cobaltochelatase